MTEPDINKVKGIFDILKNDVERSIEAVNLSLSTPENYGFNVRSYIRSYASWLEGSIWLYKHLITNAKYQWHRTLPIESQLFLYEHNWKIQSNGQPVFQKRRVGTTENIRAFLYVMSELFPNFCSDLSGSGWAAVQHFFKVRDATMHPSDLKDLNIVETDVLQIDAGRLWLVQKFSQLNECIELQINISEQT